MSVTADAYRGALEFRPGTFGGMNTINAVDVDDYVQGVVPLESPSSWPAEALKAQAVAARTYALTTTKSGAGFEHYPDTRSQVYGGVSAEQAEAFGDLVAVKGDPLADMSLLQHVEVVIKGGMALKLPATTAR